LFNRLRGDPPRSELRVRLQPARHRIPLKNDYDRSTRDLNEAIRLDPKMATTSELPDVRQAHDRRLAIKAV
jgi:hypothetical protein